MNKLIDYARFLKASDVVITWITLVEHDKNNVPLFVKSAQIDGKKLKENTWYILKNKKFVEVRG